MGTKVGKLDIDHLVTLPEVTSETCDACGQGTIARVLVTLETGGQLTFCSHHAARVGLGPEMIAALVTDQPVSGAEVNAIADLDSGDLL
jgi:hypothetical protein